MTVRTTRRTVTFTRPFSVSAFQEIQLPGTYVVGTHVEFVPALWFTPTRRGAARLRDAS